MKKRIFDLISAEYEKLILIFDEDNIIDRIDYAAYIKGSGFNISFYQDVEEFRFLYESEIRNSKENWAVIVTSDIYVPFDIRKAMYIANLSMSRIFSKLDRNTLLSHKVDFELLSLAYEELFELCNSYDKTIRFIENIVYGNKNLEKYCEVLDKEIKNSIMVSELSYINWIDMAKKKGRLEYFSAKLDQTFDLKFVEDAFKDFILNKYNSLSGIMNNNGPVMLTRVLEYIARGNRKTALIVMDGMSIFDFEIISKEFDNILFDYNCCYALIPTTTSISRQSLLSGKYPVELKNPFNLAKEEYEFRSTAETLGYKKNQISYERGYNLNLSPIVKFVSIIINDIDDLVHNQMQGRHGMLNDIEYYAKKGELQHLVSDLYSNGFDIYITSDHGNTLCTGVGKPKGLGIEVETRSKRMMVLKEFADKGIYGDCGEISYPGYYLDKQYEYLICESGSSYDIQDEIVMTHGGMSIDEVIVPFIKIKGVKNG
ncbi:MULTISPECIES: PglZ domain-containing protein [unclassified Fusibacter]|uniref:PglZ domain-containing protein n=1 Tax=unclassified Fusibacter TaxID=2624464 RepID=UPI00101066BB|nr:MULTISPECIES: PglZ domain-containing protein [unclassified Fusibacter]MCK8058417.1 PglZ domain-containing protein [Fusibacter sp. A2]NPE22815.1 PglZ domain-containing protein [Fusibacter sp. A1]RXV60369.1 PglZ domain-containing protein [Fusibacter sp. A1]